MSVIGWLLLGLVAGFIGNKLWDGTGNGLVMNIVLGIVGAVVGGIVASFIGLGGISGFDLWSIIVAIVGALIVLYVYNNFIVKRG